MLFFGIAVLTARFVCGDVANHYTTVQEAEPISVGDKVSYDGLEGVVLAPPDEDGDVEVRWVDDDEDAPADYVPRSMLKVVAKAVSKFGFTTGEWVDATELGKTGIVVDFTDTEVRVTWPDHSGSATIHPTNLAKALDVGDEVSQNWREGVITYVNEGSKLGTVNVRWTDTRDVEAYVVITKLQLISKARDVGDRVSLGSQEGVVIEKGTMGVDVKIAWDNGESDWQWMRDLTLVSKATCGTFPCPDGSPKKAGVETETKPTEDKCCEKALKLSTGAKVQALRGRRFLFQEYCKAGDVGIVTEISDSEFTVHWTRTGRETSGPKDLWAEWFYVTEEAISVGDVVEALKRHDRAEANGAKPQDEVIQHM